MLGTKKVFVIFPFSIFLSFFFSLLFSFLLSCCFLPLTVGNREVCGTSPFFLPFFVSLFLSFFLSLCLSFSLSFFVSCPFLPPPVMARNREVCVIIAVLQLSLFCLSSCLFCSPVEWNAKFLTPLAEVTP